MMRSILAATTMLALATGGAFAQADPSTTGGQNESIAEARDNNDGSARLPLAGKADPADLFQNVDGSRGSSPSKTLVDSNEQIQQKSQDDPNMRVKAN